MKDIKKPLNYAFFLLKYRNRSCYELAQRLSLKKYPLEQITKVIEYLKGYGYLNDEVFSRGFIANSQAKHWGSRKIQAYLSKLKVSEQIYRKYLPKSDLEINNIRKLIKKKIERFKDEKNTYQKIGRFLVNKGFDYQDISQVLREYGIKDKNDS